MNDIFLSFLVTCKNETETLFQLLQFLSKYTENNECIILDDYSDNPETLAIINSAYDSNPLFFKVHQHKLNNNYGEHKNYGKSLCKGKYIFQIDGDELPSKFLIESLKDIINLNNDVELFWVPRINDFKGVKPEHANQWGWRLTSYENRSIVNWPDPQSRIFKNLPHISWKRKLHEKVEGAKVFSMLPESFEFALYHNKTIEKQIETNTRYNTQFTEEDNRGFKY